MTHCSKCTTESTFSSPEPLCDYHWLEWFYLPFNKEQREIVKREDLWDVVNTPAGCHSMPSEEYRKAWLKLFKVTEDEIKEAISPMDVVGWQEI